MLILAVKVTPESPNLQRGTQNQRKVVYWIKSGLINQVLIRATRWREHCNKEALKY